MAKNISHLGIDLPDDIFSVPQSQADSATDIGNLVQQAFDSPLDYPPLAESIFPGDRVAIALHPEVPAAGAVIESVIDYLLAHGIEPADVTITITDTVSGGAGEHRFTIEPVATGM